jgi:hypothetical protein
MLCYSSINQISVSCYRQFIIITLTTFVIHESFQTYITHWSNELVQVTDHKHIVEHVIKLLTRFCRHTQH